MMNFTIQLPDGTTNHGDPHLICTPSTWKDLLLFYITNYFIHAATLPTVPGESKEEIAFAVLNALFIPGFGVLRVIRRLVMYPSLRRGLSPVERACAAGALCMVLHETTVDDLWPNGERRSRQDPESSDTRLDTSWATRTFAGSMTFSEIRSIRNIHGVCKLPEGYSLELVPFGTRLRQVSGGSDGNTDIKFRIGSEYSVVKALFSLVQIIAGSITIYRARGDQITQYGYASFGLSVVPYVFMSTVNAIASVLSPTYPSMYLVRTPDMNHAESAGGRFEGVIAELIPHTGHEDKDGQDAAVEPKKVPSTFMDRDRYFLPAILIFLLSLAVPLALVGGLSKFSPGLVSSTAQRGWIMSWITIGSLSSLVALFLQFFLRDSDFDALDIGAVFFASCPFWVPAIGGMVSVGGQLREYGICTRFD